MTDETYLPPGRSHEAQTSQTSHEGQTSQTSHKAQTKDNDCTLTIYSMYFITRQLPTQLNRAFHTLFFLPFFLNHYGQHDHLIY